MSPAAARRLKVGISLGLAVVLLLLFLRSLDFAEVGRALRAAHGGWIAVAVALGLLGTPVIRSLRWARLLARAGSPRFLDLNAATSVGFAASTLLPARAGEVVRPVYLSQATGIPVAPALASVALERVLDLVAVVTLFAAYAAGWAPRDLSGDAASSFALLRRGALLLGAATVAGIAVLVVLVAKPAWRDALLRPLGRLPRVGTAIESFLRTFLEHLGAIRTARDLLVVLAFTYLLWGVCCLQIHATLLAFDLRFPFPVTFFLLAWAVIGLAVPTPGGVGGYHAAVTFALHAFYAIPVATAGAFALLAHAISFAPITVLGLGFLVSSGLDLRSLSAPPTAGEPPPRE